jgi:hypothetical protein
VRRAGRELLAAIGARAATGLEEALELTLRIIWLARAIVFEIGRKKKKAVFQVILTLQNPSNCFKVTVYFPNPNLHSTNPFHQPMAHGFFCADS